MHRSTGVPRDALILDLALKQYGLITRTQALAAGMGGGTVDWRLRSGDWHTVGVGVYRLAGAAPSWFQRALAVCLQCAPHGFASHRSAAWVWGLSGFPKIEPLPIEVTVPRNKGVVADARVHLTRDSQGGMHRGIPVTSLARTLVDVAPLIDETSLELALDSALRKGPVAQKAIRAGVEAMRARGRPAVLVLRELLALRERALDSELEVIVRRLLWASGLPKPAHNHHVWHRKSWIAKVDFAWPSMRLVVQAHSLKWHLDPRRFRIDQRQLSELAAAGWTVLVTTWDEVTKHPARLMKHLRDAWQLVTARAALTWRNPSVQALTDSARTSEGG